MTAERRILVGQIWHEGHSFNPIATVADDFQVMRGEALLAYARGSDMAFSGIVRKAEALGYECVPIIGARARPGGPVSQAVFDAFVTEFLTFKDAENIGGICLELHGATIAEQSVDTEGELLERLRIAFGASMPISVALDLHGYVTARMVRNATILTGYRTQPHADMVETGERAVELLHRILEQDLRPRSVMARVPFLTRGSDETSTEPMLSICKHADRWRSDPGILDLSIFNVHPFLDVPDVGQVVLAYDDGAGAALRAARELASELWNARDHFVEKLPSVEAALSLAEKSNRLTVLGDQGDRVLGAGPGDSVEIARVAVEQFPSLSVATAVFDPGAVSEAEKAGIGAEIELSIGASVSPSLQPLRRRWRVVRLGPARFVNVGPYMAGVEADFGGSAVLTSDNLSVVVTEKAPNVHDPAFYPAMGLPLKKLDAVVARSANHYKLSFAPVAQTITVDTAGLTAFRPHDFPFVNARPVYPLDPVQWDFDSMTEVFGGDEPSGKIHGGPVA
jgi:microcystin degradation protein MlrC